MKKCEPSDLQRKRCFPTLSPLGMTCLGEVKEAYGISQDTDAFEFALMQVRYSNECIERLAKMTLCEAARVAVSDDAKVFFANCLMSSKTPVAGSQK